MAPRTRVKERAEEQAVDGRQQERQLPDAEGEDGGAERTCSPLGQGRSREQGDERAGD